MHPLTSLSVYTTLLSLHFKTSFAICEPTQTGAVSCLNTFSSDQCGAIALTNTQCSESCSCPSGVDGEVPQVMTCNAFGSCDGATVAHICQIFQNTEQCFCAEDLNCRRPPIVRIGVHVGKANDSVETVRCSTHFADLRDCGLGSCVMTDTRCLETCSCDQSGNMTCSACGGCDAEKAASLCQSIGQCACGSGESVVLPSGTRGEL